MNGSPRFGRQAQRFFGSLIEVFLSAGECLEGSEDCAYLGTAGVVGVDVDEPYDVVGADDQNGGHRESGSAVGAGCADVHAERALCRESLLGGVECDPERVGDLGAGVAEHGVGQLVLFLGAERRARGLGIEQQPTAATPSLQTAAAGG